MHNMCDYRKESVGHPFKTRTRVTGPFLGQRILLVVPMIWKSRQSSSYYRLQKDRGFSSFRIYYKRGAARCITCDVYYNVMAPFYVLRHKYKRDCSFVLMHVHVLQSISCQTSPPLPISTMHAISSTSLLIHYVIYKGNLTAFVVMESLYPSLSLTLFVSLSFFLSFSLFHLLSRSLSFPFFHSLSLCARVYQRVAWSILVNGLSACVSVSQSAQFHTVMRKIYIHVHSFIAFSPKALNLQLSSISQWFDFFVHSAAAICGTSSTWNLFSEILDINNSSSCETGSISVFSSSSLS